MKIQTVIAATALTLTLTSCSSGQEAAEATPEPPPTDTTTPPAVYDEAEVIDHLGVKIRPDGDNVPNDFLYDDGSYVADYRWESPDGEVCFLSNIITSAGEADMAGPSKVLDPTGAAGVEFYADTENLATCSDLLTAALADFPA